MRLPKSQASGNSANRKKVLIGLAILGATSAIAIGGSLAFFSDTLSTTNTAKSGTLDITMEDHEHKLYLNGTAVASTELKNINPGDVIVVKGQIDNKGNKSAWIQETFDITGNMPDLTKIKVYKGEYTQANIGTASGAITLTGTGGNGTGMAPIYVMNGTGTAAETEKNISASGTVPNGTTIASGDNYPSIYTIYFDPTAGNTYQGKDMSIKVTVKAMQYRNNPTPVWANVVSTEFGE